MSFTLSSSRVSRFAIPALVCVLGALSGCTSDPSLEKAGEALTLSGKVLGGQQPVNGSTIQLYTVGTSGDASAATPLIASTVKTDANGNFNITLKYSCPSATALVYLTATGGNPGLSTGSNNANLAMMAALGQCGTLSAATNIFVDEVTTVGSIAALYPYRNSFGTVGSGTADASAFASAFSTVAEFTNTAERTDRAPTTSATAKLCN